MLCMVAGGGHLSMSLIGHCVHEVDFAMADAGCMDNEDMANPQFAAEEQRYTRSITYFQTD
jgi:hypothetical protein